MEKTRKQLLRDPDMPPTSEVLAQALGEAHTAYLKFVDELSDHDVQLEWRYYKDGGAWLAKGLHQWVGVRGGRKAITVFWLSVWDGFFEVSLYIPEKAWPEVLTLPIGDEVKRMVADSKQMGKLKFFSLVFDLCSDELFEAVLLLADFKKKLR